MAKKLESISIRKAENGFTVGASYRDEEADKGNVCGSYSNKDYVLESKEGLSKLIGSLLEGSEPSISEAQSGDMAPKMRAVLEKAPEEK